MEYYFTVHQEQVLILFLGLQKRIANCDSYPYLGKTLIAKQIAKELKGRFINLKLSDILRGHIGVGEQRIRELFADAKTYAPSVLFIDEFQSLFSARVGLEQGPVLSLLHECCCLLV